ncbi:MAG: ribosome maturation factor RimP [Gammaproteobacteria bacterium]|nr:ribosome maturation factor RimP [Gammaproteobacteria bacterium]
MRRVSESVAAVLQPVIEGLGYSMLGAQLGQAENGHTLRIYIDTDRADGIQIEDCATVSRQLSAVLDVEDVIDAAYQLEVSSPGLDRPLFDEPHFAEQIGETIKVRMSVGVNGRRSFTGELLAVENSEAIVEVDGLDYNLPIADVEWAHLVGRI